jgi:hypothetical protein
LARVLEQLFAGLALSGATCRKDAEPLFSMTTPSRPTTISSGRRTSRLGERRDFDLDVHPFPGQRQAAIVERGL